MKRIFSILFTVVLVLGLSLIPAVPAVAATPIYVNAGIGNDDWDGQAAAWDGIHGPKATIAAGIGVVDSSGTVYVAAGTYYEHVTIGKSLVLQGEDRDSTVIDGSGSGNVIYITANYVTISGFKVTNGDNGIRLIPNWAIHHVTISDVIITANATEGIEATHSRYSPGAYHVIEDSIISNNGGMALYAHQFSKSIIRDCEVFGNGGSRALNVAWGFDTLITNNNVHDNAGFGIWLDSMTYTIVEKNESWNNGGGIGVGYVGNNNTIRDNIVHHNAVGIEMNYPPVIGNKIYHNAFIDNTLQVRELGTNIWDDGYPSGGNYWSDYAGVDDYSGPSHNVPGSDGIGDTPYTFTGNQDNYPLMTPWVTGVSIDIKPGSDPNSINPKSKGLIPVAILGSDTFDVTDVDVTTLEFGPDGATPTHDLTDPLVYAEHLQDVNLDGHLDLVSHYKTQETGIASGDTSATLTGQTTGGIPIEGTDSVRTVGKP